MSTEKIERNGNRTQMESGKLNSVICLYRVIRTLSLAQKFAHNVSANVIAWNRFSLMEIRWNKNEAWRLSSLMAARRWPSSWRNSTHLTLMGPSVSNACGMNVYVCWSLLLLLFFIFIFFYFLRPPARSLQATNYKLGFVWNGTLPGTKITLMRTCFWMLVRFLSAAIWTAFGKQIVFPMIRV